MESKIGFVPSFDAVCLLYAAATVLWVWVLTNFPLSTVYPFVGLSFVMVVLAGWFFLGKTRSIGGWIGVLMVAAGMALVASSAGAKF
jgi:multidrug transporter EmrE-like cation transporter